MIYDVKNFPGGLVVKDPPDKAEATGGFPGVGNGSPLQDSCLKNSMDRGT